MRHARASRATLTVDHGDGTLVVSIADNGRGLGPHVLEGTGIAGMRERALLAGGELSIGSAPNRGTSVRLQIPLTSPAR
jgi:two-component system, NarL family, sensor histidine kinase UhpB